MTTRKAASKNTLPEGEAERLRQMINSLGEYGHIAIRAESGHLNVYPDDEIPVARLTPLGAGQYGLSFRNHTGRWEPMPFTGDLGHLAEALVTTLGPYLDRYDFPDRNNGSGN